MYSISIFTKFYGDDKNHASKLQFINARALDLQVINKLVFTLRVMSIGGSLKAGQRWLSL